MMDVSIYSSMTYKPESNLFWNVQSCKSAGLHTQPAWKSPPSHSNEATYKPAAVIQKNGKLFAARKPEADIQEALKRHRKQKEMFCAACGYEGPMGWVRKHVPWYLSWWMIIPIGLTHMAAPPLGFILIVVWGFRRAVAETVRLKCPNCDFETVKRETALGDVNYAYGFVSWRTVLGWRKKQTGQWRCHS